MYSYICMEYPPPPSTEHRFIVIAPSSLRCRTIAASHYRFIPPRHCTIVPSRHRQGTIVPSRHRQGTVVPSGHRQGTVVLSRHRQGTVVSSRHRQGTVVPSRHRQGNVVSSRHRQRTVVRSRQRHRTVDITPLRNCPRTQWCDSELRDPYYLD